MSKTQVPRLLSVKQVAAMLGEPEWRVYEWLAGKNGPPQIRIGRTIRVSEAALVRWIEEKQES